MDSTDTLINAIEGLAVACHEFEKLTDQHRDFQKMYHLPEPNQQRLLAAREHMQVSLTAANL